MPRILKINWIKGLSVSVVFNNGESRVIDFEQVLPAIGIHEGSPAGILYRTSELRKVQLANHTLSWENVEQYISQKDGTKIKVPFEVGADVLLQFSKPERTESNLKIGKLVRQARQQLGLTQQELALMSGTSRTYISRIENDKSDVELSTLQKIIETGLGKRLDIRIE